MELKWEEGGGGLLDNEHNRQPTWKNKIEIFWKIIPWKKYNYCLRMSQGLSAGELILKQKGNVGARTDECKLGRQ